MSASNPNTLHTECTFGYILDEREAALRHDFGREINSDPIMLCSLNAHDDLLPPF